MLCDLRGMEAVSPASLVDLLKTYRYQVGSEAEFQHGLEEVMARHGIVFLRGYELGPEYGRIDFYLPFQKYGVELKVKGSPVEVLPQLHLHAQCPRISALILITGRDRLAFAPASLHGRPLLTASLWDSELR